MARDAAWSTTSVLTRAVAQAVVVVAMVRIVGVDVYGRYAYAAAIVGPLALVGGLKMRSVVASDADGEVAQSDYRQAAWLAAGISAVMALILANIDVVARGASLTMIAVMVIRGLDGVAEVEYGSLQRAGRFRVNAQLVLLNAILSATIVVFVLMADGSLELALAGSAASSAVTYLLALLVSRRTLLHPSRSSEEWRARPAALAWRLAPLGAANAIGTAKQAVPRMMLEWSVGREAVGSFVAGYNILSVLALPIGATGIAATPRLARLHAEGRRQSFQRLLRSLVRVGMIMAVLLVLCVGALGNEVLALVYDGAVTLPGTAFLMMAMSVGLGFLYMFYGTAVNAMRMFNVQLPIAMATAVIAVVASIAFIPPWGVYGAAATLLAIVAVDGALYWRLVRGRITDASSEAQRDASSGRRSERVVG